MGIANSDSQEIETFGFSHSESEKLCERSQTSLVDPRLNVPVSDTLEIDHCGCNIAVSHPRLKCANVDAVLKMTRSIE
jgi:hypothetical protein